MEMMNPFHMLLIHFLCFLSIHLYIKPVLFDLVVDRYEGVAERLPDNFHGRNYKWKHI